MTNSPSSNALNAAEIRHKYTTQVGKEKRDYLKVSGRVMLFRLDHPTGQIITEPLTVDENVAMFRASVWVDGVQIATGHARLSLAATAKAQGRMVEMTETNAIGRALANAGYGTEEFADDDNDLIADSPTEHTSNRRQAAAKPPQPPVDPASPQGIAQAWAKTCTDAGIESNTILAALEVTRLGEFDWAAANATTLADELLTGYLNTLSSANAKKPPQQPPAQTGMDLPKNAGKPKYDPALDAARN